MRNLFLICMFFVSISAAEAEDAPKKPWANETDLGVVASNGNTSSESILLKQVTAYTYEKLTAKITGNYLKNSSTDSATNVTTDSEIWDTGLRFDYSYSDRLGSYIGQGMESNKPSGIKRRYNSDLGGKYYFIKSDSLYLESELGYRYSIESYTTGAQGQHYDLIRLYTEAEKKWTSTFSSKLWVEYLPNIDQGQDYHINGEASVSAVLTDLFSLKTAYLAKYANIPTAQHRTDTLFSTSLIAKF